MKRLIITAIAAAGLLLVPAGADAAKVSIDGSSGPAAELFVQYKGEAGERNSVVVKETIAPDTVTITDRGAKRMRIAKGDGRFCKVRGARTVVCKDVSLTQLYLGAGDDRVRYVEEDPGALPPYADPLKRQNQQSYPNDADDEEGGDVAEIVDGGPGNDIIDAAFGDVVYPGAGRDVVRGDALDVVLGPDGAKDSITGGKSSDSISFEGSKPVTVDLAARTDNDGDTLANIDEVIGTPAADTLRGSDANEKLRGYGGGDTIDGRGGADLILPDEPSAFEKPAKPAKITAGAGDDVVDARAVAPGTTIDCGAGTDLVAGKVDDRLNGTCESTFMSVDIGSMLKREALTPANAKLDPAGSAAMLEVACPTAKEWQNSGCAGQVAIGDQSAPFALKPGERGSVKVPLVAGVKPGDTVTVRVTGKILPPAGRTGDDPIDAGWSQPIV
jgi:Ca2+-binding RTX toxin-like protein